MKKPKLNINFGEGGFQGWLVRHCEKMILGVIILLALWVIWGGYGLPGLGGDKSPDKLRAAASSQRTQITDMTWDKFKELNPDRLQRTVTKDQPEVPINPLDYPRPSSWNPPDFKRATKRTDPEIYPPINLKVVPFVGPVAYQPVAGMKDGLTGETAKGGAAGPQRVGGGGGVPSPMGPMGGAGPGEEPPGGADLLSEFADSASGLMPGEDGMEGGMDGTRIAPVESSHFQAPSNAIAKTKYAVVLLAAVQHEKQWEEYERKLRDSLDFEQTRDQPKYITTFVQRVDVTDDPTIDPAAIPDDAWKPISRHALSDALKWAGYPSEAVGLNYLEPADPSTHIGLTQPIPPFVQRDLWEAMTHPDIPLASAARQMPSEFMPEEEMSAEEDEIPGIPGVGAPGRRGIGPGGMMPGAGGMMPGAGGMMPGMGGMMPGAGGMMPGAGGMGGMMPGMGGMMPGDDGMGGMGIGGHQASFGPQVKYKLIRVTDFSVEPGRKYRYRLKLVLDDPNNSQFFAAPRLAALDPEVQTRINADKAKDRYYLTGKDWSAPSDVVSLPAEHWFYAGKVDSDAGQVLVKDTRPVRREPTAKIVAIVHDPDKGADVPLEQVVRPGSTINLKAEVNVIHPIKGIIHNFKDYALRTDAFVADILGGEVIPNIHKERSGDKMTVPGEILMIDSDGNLFVQDEAEDVDDFRRYVPPEETKKPAGGFDPMNPMDPMGGMGPGEEAGPGESPMVPMGRGGRGRRGM
ncbi:MAG TPA: hypothetical protein VMP01_26220 [Pirellulaceae bacterium]|nr:hypothetical protein [Pirellulaceae bacterium]